MATGTLFILALWLILSAVTFVLWLWADDLAALINWCVFTALFFAYTQLF